jgi:hypothetical protein
MDADTDRPGPTDKIGRPSRTGRNRIVPVSAREKTRRRKQKKEKLHSFHTLDYTIFSAKDASILNRPGEIFVAG